VFCSFLQTLLFFLPISNLSRSFSLPPLLSSPCACFFFLWKNLSKTPFFPIHRTFLRALCFGLSSPGADTAVVDDQRDHKFEFFICVSMWPIFLSGWTSSPDRIIPWLVRPLLVVLTLTSLSSLPFVQFSSVSPLPDSSTVAS